MIEFYSDTIGIGLVVAGVFVAVRAWGWALRPEWLRSDWCTNPLPLRTLVRVRRAYRAYRSI